MKSDKNQPFRSIPEAPFPTAEWIAQALTNPD